MSIQNNRIDSLVGQFSMKQKMIAGFFVMLALIVAMGVLPEFKVALVFKLTK